MPILDDPVSFKLRIPRGLMEEARTFAKAESMSLAVLLRRLLLDWVKSKKQEEEQNNAN